MSDIIQPHQLSLKVPSCICEVVSLCWTPSVVLCFDLSLHFITHLTGQWLQCHHVSTSETNIWPPIPPQREPICGQRIQQVQLTHANNHVLNISILLFNLNITITKAASFWLYFNITYWFSYIWCYLAKYNNMNFRLTTGKLIWVSTTFSVESIVLNFLSNHCL